MDFPKDIKYARSHEWLRTEGNTGTVGITEFAQGELGDVVFVDITAGIGDELKAGEAFGTIEAVKTVSDVYMPVDGKILEVNPAIGDAPESINKDPYGNGWLVKIEVTGGTEALMDPDAYAEMVSSGAH